MITADGRIIANDGRSRALIAATKVLILRNIIGHKNTSTIHESSIGDVNSRIDDVVDSFGVFRGNPQIKDFLKREPTRCEPTRPNTT